MPLALFQPFSYSFCLCLREACETALKEKHIRDISQMEGFLDESDNSLTSHLEHLETLRRVFREAAEADIPSEVNTWVPLFNGVIFESFLMNCYLILLWRLYLSGARLPLL